MTLRKKAPRARERWITLGFAVTAAMLLVVATVVALANTNFDAADGNLIDNGGGESDWATVGIDCPPSPILGCAIDKPTGQTDDSFGQGTKEDSDPPTIVDGSIPNNKSDLTRFYVFNDKQNAKDFLYLAWERVQEPNGTTNMDFEFNQKQCTPGLTPADPDCSANGVTPTRSAGDVLIKYDLSQGGVNPTLGYHTWVTSGTPATVCEASNSVPCWGPVQNLTGNFEGSTNSGTVDDPINPDATRNLSARTFGEAAINLTDSGILPGGGTSCTGFGSAYLKSRSSDSFTAAVKDFIAPIPVNISNCGKIIVDKTTNPAGDPTSFAFTLTGGPDSINQSFNLTDAATPHDSGQVKAGSGYVVAETVPSGWTNTSATCDDGSLVTNVGVSVGETVTCTFVNRKEPTLTVNKVLVPATDSGLFNLQIDGFTAGTGGNVGNGGTTGAIQTGIGPHTVGETAGTGTSLTDYVTSIGGDCLANGTITLAAGDAKTCTITNSRLPRVAVVKDLIPSADPGRFVLRIQDTAGTTTYNNSNNGFGDGGTTGFQNVAVGSITVSELAHTGTALGDYTSSVSCDSSKGGSSGTSHTFTVAYGDSVTCTITNTRRTFTVIVLVCEGSSLYSSSVTMDSVTTSSLEASSSPTDAVLCALSGARYTGLLSGNQPDIDVAIGLLELP